MNSSDIPLPPVSDKGKSVAPLIDHTLLKADADQNQIKRLCREADFYGFAAVCVNPFRIPFVSRLLTDSLVKVATVIGFPLGASATLTKVCESTNAVKQGADELDMVISIGSLKDRNYAHVTEDIRAVINASGGKTVKVILETYLLSKEEKITACRLAVEAGADFVKTSTGLGKGATEADVRLLRRITGNKIGVKASGGIRTYSDAMTMINAGASRIGTSAGVSIVTES